MKTEVTVTENEIRNALAEYLSHHFPQMDPVFIVNIQPTPELFKVEIQQGKK